jgi:translation initiation factor 2B subunit (eIF-2B alpha/beta/delta family)
MDVQRWLSDHDEERAREMKKFVIAFWDHKGDLLTYTPHDPGHFARVERNMQRLIPNHKWASFSDSERMVLTWCAWTHDVGMHAACYPDEQTIKPDQVRKRHVDESAKWVRKHRQDLRLTRGEAQVISEIIVYHSRKHVLDSCQDVLMCDTEYVRAKLLAAYLRLADAMEVGQSRTEGREFDRLPLFQDLVTDERDEILFHWIKSFVVAGIAANHSKQIIEIEFQNPLRPAAKRGVDGRKFSFLVRYVANELKDELETVESTLDSGGISSFHDVSYRTIERTDAEGEDGWSKLLPSVINHLQMAYSPNSTGIARAGLESLKAIIDDSIDGPGDFKGRLFQLASSLNRQLGKRSCHSEVARLRRRIETAMNALADPNKLDAVRTGLRNYIANLEIMIDGAGVASLAKGFWETVEQKCEPVANGYRFLLFGCSESVAAVLATRKTQVPITLYVAEGRPKTIHGAHNSPIYVDAEAYAGRIREKEALQGIPEKHAAKVVVIPDACIATAFCRGDDLGHIDKFSAVLFGSNGVYYGETQKRSTAATAPLQAGQDTSMCVAHTVGHLGMSIIAKHFRVPVIVVASTAKLSIEPMSAWSTQDRANKWLTTYTPCISHLVQECKARIDWCPREEHVPFSLLSYLVTEKGAIDLSEPANVIRRKLSTWDKSVDIELETAPTAIA